MIAIPDFPSGAMEHWVRVKRPHYPIRNGEHRLFFQGLVGFRETRLLYSDKVNSVVDKQNVAKTVVHELAHFVS
jgi:aminopeptidase N